jgi:monovalent cation:H+ antiporter-2, CPA2 family
MGSILAETPLVSKIEHLTLPVKEMFGAIFFVSVGMMIDLAIIPQYWQSILLITVAVLVFMPLSAIVGALLSRQPLKTSVQAGMSLSQIGEFSFIIATMGLNLGLTGSYLYPVAVAVSALTTFTTPYMIRLSGPVFGMLTARLPGTWIRSIDKYSQEGQRRKPTSDWNRYIGYYLLQIAIHAVIVVAIVLMVVRLALPALGPGGESPLMRLLAAVVTILLVSPFLWALAVRRILPGTAARLWEIRYYRGPMIVLQIVRFVITMVILGFIVHNIVSYVWALALLVLTIVLFLFNYRHLQRVHAWVERRFVSNLHEKEHLDLKESGAHLTPWDAHITSFSVSPDFRGVGMQLLELKWRENFGVNVAMIKRGAFVIQAPDRQERIYPEDVLYVIGTDDQLGAFKKYLFDSSPARSSQVAPEDEIVLRRIEILEGAYVVGKTIKESEIRERTKGLIVGIERDGERLLNPESSVTLHANDLLWMVGNTRRLMVFEKILARTEVTQRTD